MAVWTSGCCGTLAEARPCNDMMVMQPQLCKRQGVVPITRGYIMREEARLRTIESGRPVTLRLAGE